MSGSTFAYNFLPHAQNISSLAVQHHVLGWDFSQNFPKIIDF